MRDKKRETNIVKKERKEEGKKRWGVLLHVRDKKRETNIVKSQKYRSSNKDERGWAISLKFILGPTLVASFSIYWALF